MKTIVDEMIGNTYNRLTVMKYVGKDKRGSSICSCDCSCGKKDIHIVSSRVKTGNTKSCGCLNTEATIARNKSFRKYGNGDWKTPIYNSWSKMISRCYKDTKDAKDYKDRGILVCEEWKDDFLNFKNWSLKNGWKEDLSIDRIDVNGNYEPNNCRWTDNITQANNKTNNRRITLFGITKTLAEWCRETGFGHKTITYRLDHNWPEDKIFSKPYTYIHSE